MPVAREIVANLQKSSLIRKMFEEGNAMRARLGTDRVFDFSLGNPDLEPPPEFIAALAEVATSSGPGQHAYMTNAGYPFVRDEMARKVSAEHGVVCSADDIVMTVGAAGALNIIFRTILDPGDEVVVVRPYFAEYGAYAANHRGKVVFADSAADFSLDPDSIGRCLGPATAAVLINSPNNPTGRVYDRASIQTLAGVLRRHGEQSGRFPYLIVDEPYRDIVYDGVEVPAVLPYYAETMVATSFSKTLSIPGERLGYVAVHPELADHATMMAGLAMANRSLGFVNAPAIMQRAVAMSWRAKADISRYARRRDMLAGILRHAGINFARPDGAFYLFCQVPERGPATSGAPGGTSGGVAGIDTVSSDFKFVDTLKEYGILAVPGSGFGQPGWFRLSYCVPEATITGSAAGFAEAARQFRG